MNKQIMIKHYEATPKETLIDILVASREEVEKLQNRNKERKRETERLNNIINKALEKSKGLQYRYGYVLDDLVYLLMQVSDKE